jgi:hypothetical protein
MDLCIREQKYAYLAGWTQQLELATGVVVAPSRQTLLLAKQAASLDAHIEVLRKIKEVLDA